MMFAHSPLRIYSGLSLSPQISALGRGAAFVLFTATLLFVVNAKAQEKTNRVNDLLKQLRSEDADISNIAANALRRMGKDAIPALITALSDPDTDNRRS